MNDFKSPEKMLESEEIFMGIDVIILTVPNTC
jgi:hypothetical protein